MNLNELKQSIDLAEYMRSRGIELKKHGRDLIGLCPFHEDGDPSLIVTPSKQLWHCMGCGKGGSIIDFVMERDGCTLAEALEQLKQEEPTSLSGHSPSLVTGHSPSPLSPERVNQLLERVITLYEKNLGDIVQANSDCDYLESRGITDKGLIGAHRIGYCNGSLPDILPKEGTISDELTALGILLDNGHERLKGCIVFPVFDPAGGIVTLYGRHTGDGAKRHLYLPDRPTGLWNIAAAKSFHEIILVESVIDGLSVMMAGYENVISIQGTNGLSEDGIAQLASLGVKRLRLLLDGDKSGREAAEKLSERIRSTGDLPSEILILPNDHDPNSFLLAEGAQALAAFLAQPGRSASCDLQPLSGGSPNKQVAGSQDANNAGGSGGCNHPPAGLGRAQESPGLLVACGLRNYRLFGIEKGARRLRATVRLEHAGKLHVDTLDLYSARARQQLCRDLCRVFEQAPDTIEGDLSRILVVCEAHDARATSDQGADDDQGEPRVEVTELDEKEALELGRDPDLPGRILRDFETCGLVGEQTNKLLCYLAMTSRKMTEPLSVLILSSSGAGKTALQDGALAFCPPEDLVKLTSLSGKALFYKDRHSLKHKVLALEEGAGCEDAAYAIRNLISADSLTTESTMRDPVSGRLTTMENTVEGPTAVFVTTTNPEVDAETRSRFLVTGVDESREQTRRILTFQRLRHGPDGLQENVHKPDILHRHRNLQRLLRPLQVVNPYAARMSYSDDRLQSRRLQPQYLSLIAAVAFLRQFQKEVKTHNGCDYIEVDLADIDLGNRLAVEILGRTLDELSIPARSLLTQLHAMVTGRAEQLKAESPDRIPRTSDIPFTRKEIREHTGWTNTRLHIHLKELVELEYVLISGGPNGRTLQLYYLLYTGEGQDGQPFIPGLEPPE